MGGPPEAGLDDLRRQLVELQSDVKRLTAYGRAVATAVATLSPAAQSALVQALGRDELPFGDDAQGDLFESSGRVQALGRSEAALARDLERALVAHAAELDEDQAGEQGRWARG
ncbi:MAG: hypothetical protein Q8L59_14355 [Phenylobacterium sp.]|uniref:hypothetical protein n=1 Tax=Phenylobacterium sp. TaxID=1871053 RepID=UPI0027370F8B|nr:hypothetical protein [Phenylobacterium sp.]MDP1643353.1 hypothetical protein [Phenylobacterium sp.]MDP3118543.1 hypothetical protein [Phenylobacterium sp.]